MTNSADHTMQAIASKFMSRLHLSKGCAIEMHVGATAIELRFTPEETVDRKHVDVVAKFYHNRFGSVVEQTPVLFNGRHMITLRLSAAKDSLQAVIDDAKDAKFTSVDEMTNATKH